MLLPYDFLNNSGDQLRHTNSALSKLSPVNQIVVAAIVIFSNTYVQWNLSITTT